MSYDDLLTRARAEAERKFPAREATNVAAHHGAVWMADWRRTRPVTDAEVEAAQVAYHEFAFGPGTPLTEREKKITRQAWRVALEDARTVEQ